MWYICEVGKDRRQIKLEPSLALIGMRLRRRSSTLQSLNLSHSSQLICV